ncbi:hypothetical protein D1871_14910 [Nakamurella silvestris]|nr:hypothetical protein D1871_14910 [Nakamurella silvestris]
MTRPGPDDPDPIANTEMFRRFVDEDPQPTPSPHTPATGSGKLWSLYVPILAVIVVVVVIVLLTR